jgi:hypothetical protein
VSVVRDDRYSRFHAGRHLIIERCFFMNIHLNRLVYMLTAAIIVRYLFFFLLQLLLRYFLKGDLISESFSLWLKSSKKGVESLF